MRKVLQLKKPGEITKFHATKNRERRYRRRTAGLRKAEGSSHRIEEADGFFLSHMDFHRKLLDSWARSCCLLDI